MCWAVGVGRLVAHADAFVSTAQFAPAFDEIQRQFATEFDYRGECRNAIEVDGNNKHNNNKHNNNSKKCSESSGRAHRCVQTCSGREGSDT